MIFDLSGLLVRVKGAPDPLARRLSDAWRAFKASSAGVLFLDADVAIEGGEPRPEVAGPKGMEARFGPGSAEFRTIAGWAKVDERGAARLRLAFADDGVQFLTLQNLIRAAVAWRLPSRGGAALHSAGFVVEGRAFLVVGPAGAGKSTAAALAESAGARVLSDDLVLLDSAGAGFEALGAPFRSTHPTPAAPGRYPLAAILFPVHAASPRLDRVSPLLARARVLANLTFIAETLGRDERIADVLEHLLETVPMRALAFAREASFVELLRSFAPSGGER